MGFIYHCVLLKVPQWVALPAAGASQARVGQARRHGRRTAAAEPRLAVRACRVCGLPPSGQKQSRVSSLSCTVAAWVRASCLRPPHGVWLSKMQRCQALLLC